MNHSWKTGWYLLQNNPSVRKDFTNFQLNIVHREHSFTEHACTLLISELTILDFGKDMGHVSCLRAFVEHVELVRRVQASYPTLDTSCVVGFVEDRSNGDGIWYPLNESTLLVERDDTVCSYV